MSSQGVPRGAVLAVVHEPVALSPGGPLVLNCAARWARRTPRRSPPGSRSATVPSVSRWTVTGPVTTRCA
ncbi:hypothetical protein O1M63_06460 [Streptomyces mirabilis]|nr:hypothetical protein [Streptomyces mirabilis]